MKSNYGFYYTPTMPLWLAEGNVRAYNDLYRGDPTSKLAFYPLGLQARPNCPSRHKGLACVVMKVRKHRGLEPSSSKTASSPHPWGGWHRAALPLLLKLAVGASSPLTAGASSDRRDQCDLGGASSGPAGRGPLTPRRLRRRGGWSLNWPPSPLTFRTYIRTAQRPRNRSSLGECSCC